MAALTCTHAHTGGRTSPPLYRTSLLRNFIELDWAFRRAVVDALDLVLGTWCPKTTPGFYWNSGLRPNDWRDGLSFFKRMDLIILSSRINHHSVMQGPALLQRGLSQRGATREGGHDEGGDIGYDGDMELPTWRLRLICTYFEPAANAYIFAGRSMLPIILILSPGGRARSRARLLLRTQ